MTVDPDDEPRGRQPEPTEGLLRGAKAGCRTGAVIAAIVLLLVFGLLYWLFGDAIW